MHRQKRLPNTQTDKQTNNKKNMLISQEALERRSCMEKRKGKETVRQRKLEHDHGIKQ